MNEQTQGRRVECPFAADGGLLGKWPQPGDYYLYPNQGWEGIAPNGARAALYGHAVTEHEDGTITVSPSILVGESGLSWHGYLERGVWREC